MESGRAISYGGLFWLFANFSKNRKFQFNPWISYNLPMSRFLNLSGGSLLGLRGSVGFLSSHASIERVEGGYQCEVRLQPSMDPGLISTLSKSDEKQRKY